MARRVRPCPWVLIALYCLSVAVADLAVYAFGPRVLPLTAFGMVGMELGTRNRLHTLWAGRRPWPRLVALIGSGSCLSAALCPGSGRVAASSFAAFLASGLAATYVFAHARRAPGPWSAATGAAVDSMVFPVLAFGRFDPVVSLSQWAGKTLGGVVWSCLLDRAARARPHDVHDFEALHVLGEPPVDPPGARTPMRAAPRA